MSSSSSSLFFFFTLVVLGVSFASSLHQVHISLRPPGAITTSPPMTRYRSYKTHLYESSDASTDGNDNTNTVATTTNDVKQRFDEDTYELDRLAKDQKAMDTMKDIADEEYAKGLRTPWKWKLRKQIWDYMENNDIARFPRPVHHRIPNFVDADIAAQRLSQLPEFQTASTIKVNPDTPQRPVRHLVLESGKMLLTPQPRLRTGFFSTVDMKSLPPSVKIQEFTNSKGVVKWGTPVSLNEEYTVDLVIVGSTAVCPRTGARVGKGEGFAELEWGILTQLDNIVDADKCLVVTTVHDCQVLDNINDMPEGWKLTQHDVPVDIIVTPTRTIRVPNRSPKPSGIFWELLSPQKLAQIRVLRQLKEEIEVQSGTSLPSGPDEILPPIASRNKKKKKKPQKKKDNTQKRKAQE